MAERYQTMSPWFLPLTPSDQRRSREKELTLVSCKPLIMVVLEIGQRADIMQKHRPRLGQDISSKIIVSKILSCFLPLLHHNEVFLVRTPQEHNKIRILSISLFLGELFLALVTSKRAHAKITRTDPSAALEVPGVHGFIDHTDIQGQNLWGTIFQDEELFASNEVSTVFI